MRQFVPHTAAYLSLFQMSVASFQSIPTFCQTTTYLPFEAMTPHCRSRQGLRFRQFRETRLVA